MPNKCLPERASATETRQPVGLYSHYVDRLYILPRLSPEESHALIQHYLSASSHPKDSSVIDY